MKATLYPRPGLRVRKPQGNAYLPPDGESVEVTGYWRRRLRDGDVTKQKPTFAKASAGKPASASRKKTASGPASAEASAGKKE